MPETPLEITPVEVKAKLDRGERILLIDVREPEEHAICHIEGAELIPMRTVPQNLQRLDSEEASAIPIIVFCHHGVRSLSVVDWLRRQGVENCRSMAGGTDRWSLEVDPDMRRY